MFLEVLQQTATAYGGQLRICSIGRRGQATKGGYPDWGLGVADNSSP